MSSNVSLTVVVAAVIRDVEGRILLTQRLEGTHMGGLWEFPGGKVEAGERPEDALRRELTEEIGTAAEIGDPMTFAVHCEPEMRILLLFYSVSIGDARPVALEGQEIAWVARHELNSYPMPPADTELVRRLIDEVEG